jgi:uncharacterized membrane protein YphA (DoxX/SURF4 family)
MERSKECCYSHQAFFLLRLVFVIAPIVAGLDKFAGYLTDWTQYLSPMALSMVGGRATGFMQLVGLVEIIAGLGVLWKPKVFATIVAIWLLCIVINLLMLGTFYDIALRDFGLCLSALALARLSCTHSSWSCCKR